VNENSLDYSQKFLKRQKQKKPRKSNAVLPENLVKTFLKATHSNAAIHVLRCASQWGRLQKKGYKECSILPTLLMTLLSRFCISNKRLYQLSDSEVTSPEERSGQ
jgi:hypothetical protein